MDQATILRVERAPIIVSRKAVDLPSHQGAVWAIDCARGAENYPPGAPVPYGIRVAYVVEWPARTAFPMPFPRMFVAASELTDPGARVFVQGARWEIMACPIGIGADAQGIINSGLVMRSRDLVLPAAFWTQNTTHLTDIEPAEMPHLMLPFIVNMLADGLDPYWHRTWSDTFGLDSRGRCC